MKLLLAFVAGAGAMLAVTHYMRVAAVIRQVLEDDGCGCRDFSTRVEQREPWAREWREGEIRVWERVH